MKNKQLRIAITVSQEEYDKIKSLSGIASLSAYIRSKLFGNEIESLKNTDLKKWVDFLLTMDDRNEIYDNFWHRMEKDIGKMQYAFRKWIKN